MCNPRRVLVRATRQLAEAWEHEVRRQVTRTGLATGEARVREPLGVSVGGPALTALNAVLAADPEWERVGDTFVYGIDGGRVIYHPLSRELEIVATASADVEATGASARTVSGRLSGDIEAEGVGVHYDDNWGGITADDARRVARERAEAALEAAAREHARAARAAADEREGAELVAQAEVRAEAALAQATAARERELRAAAAARLAVVGVHGRNAFHRALAAAYRDAVLAFARSRRAEGVRCTEADGIVDIQFELQI
jgi:FtsH ternary system domain X2